MPLPTPCDEPPESTLCLIPDSIPCHSRPHCPVPTCDVCPSVARLEAEILRAEERVLQLKKNLVFLKSEANRSHDPFTRLPTELVSEIFKFYCETSLPRFTFSNKAPLVIGKVCRRWREVTLVTPQLWASVVICAHTEMPYDLDVATEWLSRSRSLPLTLDIKFDTDDSTEPVEDGSLLPLIHLIRFHSVRWRDISIITIWETNIIPSLFANLEKMPSNFGALYLDTPTHNMGCISDTRLFPQILELSEGSSTIGFPLGWDRLTSLSSSGIEALYLEELLHIIKYAPVLTQCTLTLPLEAEQHSFDFPDVPVVSRSITHLEMGSSELNDGSDNLLHFLSLPSLKTLRYHYECQSAEDVDFVILSDFLHRCSPPLNEFHLTITPNEPNYVPIWRHDDFPVTSLAYDASAVGPVFEDQIKSTNELMALLSSALNDGGLPKLRSLQFTPAITPDFWSNLCDLIRKFARIPSSDCVPAYAEPQPIAGGLQSVVVYLGITAPGSRSPFGKTTVSMEAAVHSRLLEMERSGVDIQIIQNVFVKYPFHQLDVTTLATKI